MGICAPDATTLRPVELIQIGQPLSRTVQQFIGQMAARQHDEIEQLKRVAFESKPRERLGTREQGSQERGEWFTKDTVPTYKTQRAAC